MCGWVTLNWQRSHNVYCYSSSVRPPLQRPACCAAYNWYVHACMRCVCCVYIPINYHVRIRSTTYAVVMFYSLKSNIKNFMRQSFTANLLTKKLSINSFLYERTTFVSSRISCSEVLQYKVIYSGRGVRVILCGQVCFTKLPIQYYIKIRTAFLNFLA